MVVSFWRENCAIGVGRSIGIAGECVLLVVGAFAVLIHFTGCLK